MSSLIAAGGPWNLVIATLGFAAIAAGVLQLRRAGRSDLGALVVGLTCATFFVSVLAYGLGMWSAVGVAAGAEPAKGAALMALAQGYASTVLATGSLLATLGAITGAVACQRHRAALFTASAGS